METIKATNRTTVRRGPKKACYDRETIYRILDEAWVCHIGVNVGGSAMVQPNLHWRIGDQLYLHGSSKNGLFRALLDDETACITVTLLDGLVFAKSAFNHSVNFRSVMLYGKARLVEAEEEKQAALDALLNRFSEGRSEEARAPDATELKATSVFAFPIEEVSAKIRSGGPVDKEQDLELDIWSGVKPIITRIGELES